MEIEHSIMATGSFSIEPAPFASLVVTNEDGGDLVRLEADGTVSGDLAQRYPEAVPALTELGARIKDIMSKPAWG